MGDNANPTGPGTAPLMTMARVPADITMTGQGSEEDIPEEPMDGGEGEKGSEVEATLWRALALKEIGGSRSFGRQAEAGLRHAKPDERDDDIFEV